MQQSEHILRIFVFLEEKLLMGGHEIWYFIWLFMIRNSGNL